MRELEKYLSKSWTSMTTNGNHNRKRISRIILLVFIMLGLVTWSIIVNGQIFLFNPTTISKTKLSTYTAVTTPQSSLLQRFHGRYQVHLTMLRASGTELNGFALASTSPFSTNFQHIKIFASATNSNTFYGSLMMGWSPLDEELQISWWDTTDPAIHAHRGAYDNEANSIETRVYAPLIDGQSGNVVYAKNCIMFDQDGSHITWEMSHQTHGEAAWVTAMRVKFTRQSINPTTIAQLPPPQPHSQDTSPQLALLRRFRGHYTVSWKPSSTEKEISGRAVVTTTYSPYVQQVEITLSDYFRPRHQILLMLAWSPVDGEYQAMSLSTMDNALHAQHGEPLDFNMIDVNLYTKLRDINTKQHYSARDLIRFDESGSRVVWISNRIAPVDLIDGIQKFEFFR